MLGRLDMPSPREIGRHQISISEKSSVCCVMFSVAVVLLLVICFFSFFECVFVCLCVCYGLMPKINVHSFIHSFKSLQSSLIMSMK